MTTLIKLKGKSKSTSIKSVFISQGKFLPNDLRRSRQEFQALQSTTENTC